MVWRILSRLISKVWFGLVVSCLFCFGLVWKASRGVVHRCRSLTCEGWLQVATNAVLEGASGGRGGSGRLIVVAGSLF